MTYEEAIEWFESVIPYYDDEEEAITIAIECIKKQTTINQWIPVSERLPNVCKPVLIYKTSGRIDFDYIDYDNSWHFALFDNWVLAWMPLPEPYKGDDNDVQP